MTAYLKISFFHLSLMAIVTAANAQVANFTVTVKMTKPMDDYKAFLYYVKPSETKPTVDSVAYANGKFEIKGKTVNPQKAFLYVEKANCGIMPNVTKAPAIIYLEKGNILVSGNTIVKDARLSGTPLNKDYQEYLNVLDSFKPRLDSLRNLWHKAYQRRIESEKRSLNNELNKLEIVTKEAEENYFYSHLYSQVSLDWLKQNLNVPRNKAKAVTMFEKMTTGVKNSAAGKAYSELLASTSPVELGEIAPDFTAKNIQGENVALNSYRGKYVLLDFWASWCVPCRKENPIVLKAFNDFKDKNFTVVSFSMDETKKAWENAVVKDALPWEQLSDLKAWDGAGSHLYGIVDIPSNFLINPQGKIIAMDLRGEALEKKLGEMLNTANK